MININHPATCLCQRCVWEEVREDVLKRQAWDQEVAKTYGWEPYSDAWDLKHAEVMEQAREQGIEGDELIAKLNAALAELMKEEHGNG